VLANLLIMYFVQVFSEDFVDDELEHLLSGTAGPRPCQMMSQSMTAAVPSSIEALLPSPACRSSLYEQRASSSLIGRCSDNLTQFFDLLLFNHCLKLLEHNCAHV
jgi:hypothetical protein